MSAARPDSTDAGLAGESPPRPRLILCSEVPPQPWRNGGGLTRELLTWPPGEDWRLRISVADISGDGLFSSFAGVQRWFAVIEGSGVELTIDGALRRQTRCDAPLAFDGAARTDCRLLAGPTRDLNLMLRGAGGATGATSTPGAPVDGRAGGLFSAVADRVWSGSASPCGLFAVRAGRCVAAGLAIALPALALLCFDRAPGPLRFEPGAAAADADGPAGWWWSAPAQENAA